MYLAALFVLTVFAAQLVRVQAFDASRVQEAALAKRLTTEVLLPTRGRILDSKGNVLAASVERRTVTVNQTAVKAFRQYVDGRLVTTGVVGAAQASCTRRRTPSCRNSWARAATASSPRG